MFFDERIRTWHRVDLEERSVSITTNDLSNMGLSVSTGMKIPNPFVILDRSVVSEGYPRLENWQLDSGDKVLLVAESEMNDPHFENTFVSLALPGGYTYGYIKGGRSDGSFGGTVQLGMSVQTDVHTRDDVRSMMPQMRKGFGRYGAGVGVSDITEIAKHFGFPNTTIKLEIERYFARTFEKDKYLDEKIELSWAFSNSDLVGVSLETGIQDHTDPDRKKRKGLFEDSRWGVNQEIDESLWKDLEQKWRFKKWGCGVYPTNEGRGIGSGRRVEHLDGDKYRSIIKRLVGKDVKGDSPLFLAEYHFPDRESHLVIPGYREDKLVPMIASELGTAAIKSVRLD